MGTQWFHARLTMTDALSKVLEAIEDGRPVKVKPLAKAGGYSPNGFYGAVKRGDIRSIRIGRSIRIPATEARRVLGLDQQATT